MKTLPASPLWLKKAGEEIQTLKLCSDLHKGQYQPEEPPEFISWKVTVAMGIKPSLFAFPFIYLFLLCLSLGVSCRNMKLLEHSLHLSLVSV